LVLTIKKICLLEDEKDLTDVLKLFLTQHNYDVTTCSTIQEAKQYLSSKFDLWVLDIMVPDGSGFEILEAVKLQNPSVPVIFVSARCDSIDRVLGFKMGCTDYMSKPFLLEELAFRIQKIFNHTPFKEEINLKINSYTVDTLKREIFDNDTIYNEITSREYDLILYFLKNSKIALSRDSILNSIWGDESFVNDRAVDNCIKNIRKKLPNLTIETIRGFGYRLNL